MYDRTQILQGLEFTMLSLANSILFLALPVKVKTEFPQHFVQFPHIYKKICKFCDIRTSQKKAKIVNIRKFCTTRGILVPNSGGFFLQQILCLGPPICILIMLFLQIL